ncbi:MAG: hypothetical protein IPK15_17560 [Verrucomicrobia bacterium]|nr:hypothetical protein [Verrucomicrobiota bacterium]
MLQHDRRFASGVYDITFWLYPSLSSGTPVASNSISGLGLESGLFSAPVDFGNTLLNGRDAWLAITIATNGSTLFRQLQSRTRITPAPRALYASVAARSPTAAFAWSNSRRPARRRPAGADLQRHHARVAEWRRWRERVGVKRLERLLLARPGGRRHQRSVDPARCLRAERG